MKRSGEENIKKEGAAPKGPPDQIKKPSRKPISLSSFPTKVAAAIERKLRREKLSRTDYFIRLALKDLFNQDGTKPENRDGAV